MDAQLIDQLRQDALRDLAEAKRLLRDEGYTNESKAHGKILSPAVKLQRDAFDRLKALARLAGVVDELDPLERFTE